MGTKEILKGDGWTVSENDDGTWSLCFRCRAVQVRGVEVRLFKESSAALAKYLRPKKYAVKVEVQWSASSTIHGWAAQAKTWEGHWVDDKEKFRRFETENRKEALAVLWLNRAQGRKATLISFKR